jgi:hypothetical protein
MAATEQPQLFLEVVSPTLVVAAAVCMAVEQQELVEQVAAVMDKQMQELPLNLELLIPEAVAAVLELLVLPIRLKHLEVAVQASSFCHTP